MTFESKLIPILREGVEIVKMISFKKLKEALAKKHPDRETAFLAKLAGALTNTIFGAPAYEEPFAVFARSHANLIAHEQARIGAMLEELRIPLTDALRIQALCDHQEGQNSTATLLQAQDLGILLPERDLPLPHSFIELVRRLGSVFGLLLPPLPNTDGAATH
ncbi:MAG: hypothetical protein A2505_05360 [Deltaproteobacteria bacterium RIFOXYD12_FULL_55_16]|nr:MAG: hypothetical protein A2505_05360 [Deltaproteobacteria bacterium RIFOXYD12_FULL_55_16]